MDTYLKPNIQLFAEAEGQETETQVPADEKETTEERPDNLPKSQDELDNLIKERLRREKRDWEKQKKAKEEELKQADKTDEKPESDTTRVELMQARAELAAYKSGIKPDAVEDAVVLAMSQVSKNGDELNDDNIADALKDIIKRHPEWKKEEQSKVFRGVKPGEGKDKDDEKVTGIGEAAAKRFVQKLHLGGNKDNG